jgi:hypothetical protein
MVDRADAGFAAIHDTALIVPVPEAEVAVGRWRDRFDPSARLGVPAHVTVLFPFLPWSEIDDAVISAAGSAVRREGPFTAALDRVERTDEILWLRVEPEEGFLGMTATLVELWPERRPYGGRYDDVIPHLTVADGGIDRVPESVDAELAGCLPIPFRVDGVDLVRFAAGRWATMLTFPLE